MSIASDMEAAIDELSEELGSSFTWTNGTTACVPTMERHGSTLMVGGFEVSIQLSLYVKLSLMPDGLLASSSQLITVTESIADTGGRPRLGNRLTRGRSYRVGAIEKSSCGSYWVLDLVNPET